MMHLIVLFALCAVLSAVVIRLAIHFALASDIADHPGGHKQHDTSTPFVGGMGVLAALCVVLAVLVNAYPEFILQWQIMGLCSLILFVIGFTDDALRLSYKLRLVIQVAVALTMVLAGEMVIRDLGGLFLGLPLQLGWFAIPFTVFAVVGSINALNMIDGVDGLSGSLSLVSLLLIGFVAFMGDNSHNLLLAVALAGGVAGFLYFNLRYPSQRSARVFLGDNGSMLLGFLLAWLLLDLSQGSSPAMQPVVALWLLSIPLMDAISVMLRRVWMGKSPFSPDRNHLHHILLNSGFSVEQVVSIMVLLHLLLGMIGLSGLYLGVPELAMLLAFILIYLGYFKLTLQPWRYIPALHCFLVRLGFSSTASSGTFVGGYTAKEVASLTRMVSEALGPSISFWVKVFEQQPMEKSFGKRYAVALNIRLPEDETALDEKINHYVTLLQQRLRKHQDIWLRRFASRYGDCDRRMHDRRSAFSKSYASDRRATDRRRVVDRRTTERRNSSDNQMVKKHLTERRTFDRRLADRLRLGAHILVFEVTSDSLSLGLNERNAFDNYKLSEKHKWQSGESLR